jgi:hypothetical protein
MATLGRRQDFVTAKVFCTFHAPRFPTHLDSITILTTAEMDVTDVVYYYYYYYYYYCVCSWP